MNYRDIVARFQKEKNGKCAIDDFISGTRDSFIKKIVALNFFEEIHFGALGSDKLNECIDEFEEQLEEQFKDQRARHQDVDILNFTIRLNRKTIMSATRSILKPNTRFSTILSVEDISGMLSDYGSRENEDKNNVIRQSNKTHLEIISEFEDFLKKNSLLIIEKYYQILWVTDSKEIDGINEASMIRNLLELYRTGEALVKITFDMSPDFNWHKPTFFHVISGFHWLPSTLQNGWGITLNLKNLTEGVIETVAVSLTDIPGKFEINWSDTCKIEPLGECKEYPYDDNGWEEYFNRRRTRIIGLCTDNDLRNDLNFFLKKIN